MLKKNVEKAINEQMNREMYSAYLYMSMSSWSKRSGLNGFANWFMVQYHEEMFHAMKMFEYLIEQGACAHLSAISEPPADFASAFEAFEKTLEHEKLVTSCINDIVDLALSEKDHATRIFFEWYVTEQVEEEANDNEILSQLKNIGSDANGLFMLDRELAARTTTVPVEYSKGVQNAAQTAV